MWNVYLFVPFCWKHKFTPRPERKKKKKWMLRVLGLSYIKNPRLSPVDLISALSLCPRKMTYIKIPWLLSASWLLPIESCAAEVKRQKNETSVFIPLNLSLQGHLKLAVSSVQRSIPHSWWHPAQLFPSELQKPFLLLVSLDLGAGDILVATELQVNAPFLWFPLPAAL